MDRSRLLRVFSLHSWTGISVGLYIYIVSFTGCLALFDHEIHTWEDPAKRLPMAEKPIPFHHILLEWIEEESQSKGTEKFIDFVGVQYPDPHEPYYGARLSLKEEGKDTEFVDRRWNSTTGEVLPSRGEGLGTWLLDFHRDLMWPEALGGRTVGRTLVGIAGIILMLSIVTGVVSHRKILRESFSLRYTRGVRVRWRDTHNIFGVWGLPFHIMIAFTGAFLGVVAIMLPILGSLVAKGDTDALMEALDLVPAAPSGEQAVMFSVDKAFQIEQMSDGRKPWLIFISNWGNSNAEYQLHYEPEGQLKITEPRTINGVTGEPLPLTGFSVDSTTNRVFAAITPLHYATYGGFALKLLYFVLGIALCVMTIMGIMIWLERCLNGHEGQRSQTFYLRYSGFTVGCSIGIVIASVALFYLDKLYSGDEENRLTWTALTYFALWLSVILFAMKQANYYQTVRLLFAVVGVMALGVPFLNGFMTGDFFWKGLSAQHNIAAYVDVFFLMIGLIVCLVAKSLPSSRLEKQPS